MSTLEKEALEFTKKKAPTAIQCGYCYAWSAYRAEYAEGILPRGWRISNEDKYKCNDCRLKDKGRKK